uniref:Uncharacterized protein n=1 Tax=Romanomermis culicivorax TaxID=13658 RepID=A0A915HHA4_ROMCU
MQPKKNRNFDHIIVVLSDMQSKFTVRYPESAIFEFSQLINVRESSWRGIKIFNDERNVDAHLRD